MTLSLTWWGASAVELRCEDRTLAIDPYLNPAAADYVCLTREDWDHCHEPSLRAIVAGGRFERLLAPPACTEASRLDAPVGEDASDLAFVAPDKLLLVEPDLRRTGGRPPQVTELGPFDVATIASSEREPPNVLDGFLLHRWKPDDGARWPAQRGRFVGAGRLLPLGYLVTARSAGVTVYHPGDLQEAFDAQRELRGRVDVMLFPAVLLEGVELTVLDNVRPRHVVPIHHREDDPAFPIRLTADLDAVTAVEVRTGRPRAGTTSQEVARDRARMHAGHWYASAEPGLPRLEALRPAMRELGCELVTVRAGEALDLTALGAAATGG